MAFATIAIIGASVAAAGGVAKLGMSLAGRRNRLNEQRAAREEQRKMRKEYENLDTSNLAAGVRNPYENLENVFEDLTVNQQQAQFQAQQFQQSQANIMQQLQGAAGGSGIAGLAQTLANQGLLSAQKASASIGMQEAANQRAAAQGAARVQQLEGQGEMYAEKMRQAGAREARGLEYQKTSTLFGMAQQRTAAANEAIRQAKKDQMDAIGQIAQAGTQLASAGMNMPKLPEGGGNPTGIGSTGIGSIDVNQDNLPDYLTQGTNMGYNASEMYGVTGGQIGPSSFPFKINKNK
tara:strand:+ start:6911 stop:7789 length:879 start_codon:yes stop_codon:yes gene_type:complete